MIESDVIKKILDEAFLKMDKSKDNQVTRVNKLVNVTSIKPIDLPKFMTEHGIPDNAEFTWIDYDDFYSDAGVYLTWDETRELTNKEKDEWCRKSFVRYAWYAIYNSLKNLGYKRRGFNSGYLRKFKGKKIYDMYLNKEFDLLTEYYSLYFTRK